MAVFADFLQTPPIDAATLRENIRQQVRDGIEQGRLAAQAAAAEAQAAQAAVETEAVTIEGGEVILAQPPAPPAPPSPPRPGC